jgi:hypothetical protein
MKPTLKFCAVTIIALAFFSSSPYSLFAQGKQSKEAQKFGITFSGFVKSDFFVDSRQTFSPREGHFMLWPAPPKLDANGLDINDGVNFNFLPIQSRLSGKITGPNALGAKTSGVLEADFFGTTNAGINLLRMRHAFVKLNWDRAELLTGQFWHPLFNTDCFPNTVSFNHGAPINPFSRAPMVRYGYKMGKAIARIAAVAQRDFVSYGAKNGSPEYLRNAALPELYGELFFSLPFGEEKQSLTTGLLLGTHTIAPRIESIVNETTFKVDERVTGISARAFATLKTTPLTVKITGIYGENLSNVLGITGFAVTAIQDTTTGLQEYAPTASQILWTEIHTNGTRWQVGVFAGVNRNLGATRDMEDPEAMIYGLTNQITHIMRIAPRLHYHSGSTRFALEVEHTRAKFGKPNTKRDQKGLPIETTCVVNTRLLLAVYYFF